MQADAYDFNIREVRLWVPDSINGTPVKGVFIPSVIFKCGCMAFPHEKDRPGLSIANCREGHR